MTDVLVVSHACLTAINRAVYRRLGALGWSVDILVPERLEQQGFSRAADPRAAGDPPVHTLPLVGTHPRLWTYEGIDALLERLRPRVVIVDLDPGSRLVIRIGAWARRNGARVACISCDNMPRTLQSEFGRSLDTGVRYLIARALSRAARRYVDHVFAISSDIVDVQRRAGYGDRVSWMPLGFEPSLFRPDEIARRAARAELGLVQPTVAYFGRLIPEKGVHLLLEALHRLRDLPWQFLVDEFKEYAHPYVRQIQEGIDRLGLRDRVVYFDAGHEEIARYMNAADVVIVPSVSNPRWKEQYGRVAPEAMACGRLVVVTTCGALPELVADAGIVIPEGDVGAIERTLRRALTDAALRAEVGERAALSARERLSTLAQARAMHDVLERLASPTAPLAAA